MKTAIERSHIDVYPGQSARVEIDVTNTADVIDGVTAIVDGINPEWIRLERPLVSLFPESSDRLAVALDIPRDCPAGDYLVVVRVISTIDPDRQSVHDFWLTVAPAPDLDLALRPSIVTAGSVGELTVLVTNTGNATALVEVDALDPTRDVDCRLEATTVELAQGESAPLRVRMRGPRPWFGQPAIRQIHVTARVDDVVVEKIATFNRKPRIPRGVATALTLAGIIALWAFIFLWVIGEMRSQGDPAKKTGTHFTEAPENIPLAAIAGSASGRVTASTTGEGLPRITVEAMRVAADGSRTSVGSSATDDDGVYVMPGLVPGTYELRFSADGFGEIWYGDRLDASGATDPTGETAAQIVAPDDDVRRHIRIGTLEDLTGLDVELTGGLGTISGKIAIPEDAAGTELTVTATMITEQSGEGGEPVTFTQTTTTGDIELTGLPTPATYQITVSGPGFEQQQFEQSVGGGDAAVLNTVDIVAATGTIEGIVVDGAGSPLGGVTVVARTGETEVQAITPTADGVGTFRLVGLHTPETYVLTFTLDGHSSETIALALGAGATESVTARLVGGSGTVTGAVVDGDANPLGGITVRVVGEGYAGTTSSLTTSGQGGDVGSFTLADLPVPGDYSITLTADGYQTETLSAAFTDAGTASVGTITLLPVTAEISGSVTTGGVGLGEVTVTLTDGVRGQVTTSATNPPGSYAFAGVAPGSYTLTFARAGYQDRVVLVQVEAGIDVARDVQLQVAS